MTEKTVNTHHREGECMPRAQNAQGGLLAFVEKVARLKKWGEPDEIGDPFEPSDGVDDSHSCLMGLIDEARAILAPEEVDLVSYCQQICGGGNCGPGPVCMYGIDCETEMPVSLHAPISGMAEIDMTSIVGDYDAPGDVEEWRWIQSVASFAHRSNGLEPGVWEFVVNLAMTLDDIPPRLAPALDDARRKGADYVLFHQG